MMCQIFLDFCLQYCERKNQNITAYNDKDIALKADEG